METCTTQTETVGEFIAWMRDVRHSRASSLWQYENVLGSFVMFLDGRDWSEVRPEDIEAFMGRPRRRGIQPAAATQQRDRVIVSALFKWLHRRGDVLADPSVDVGVPRVRNHQPRAVPDDIWCILWRSEMPKDDRALLGLAYFGGLRRQEVVTIGSHHFNVAERRIEHLERKGGGTYPIEYGALADIVAEGLPHLLPSADEWLEPLHWLVQVRRESAFLAPYTLGRPVGGDSPDGQRFNGSLRRLLRRAGLPERATHPHALRHSCATNLLRCGVPIELIADQLSHAQIDTTRRYLSTSGQLGRWRARQG